LGRRRNPRLSFPRKRESRESPRLKIRSAWIPAFAGMTGVNRGAPIMDWSL
jgi:hypothetical protein